MIEERSKRPLLVLDDVRRTFRQAGEDLEVLKGINLTLEPGEIVAMLGPSGAGKSTILHLAGLLEKPTSGQITVENRPCGRLSDRERTALRRKAIGLSISFIISWLILRHLRMS